MDSLVSYRWGFQHDKTNKKTVRPAKTQISLGWSESLLCNHWVAKDPRFLHVNTNTLIRLGRCPVWPESLLGAHVILLVLSWGGWDEGSSSFTGYWAFLLNIVGLYGPRQANLVLIAYASSEGSGIRAVSPEPPLLAHTSSESRGTFRQKARSLVPLNGWACAVKICNDGMLEDTNSLDGAYMRQNKKLSTFEHMSLRQFL